MQKRVCQDFEIKSLRNYRDLYLKSDTLLLANVFENIRKMCLEIHEVDTAKVTSIPGLIYQADLKKTKV